MADSWLGRYSRYVEKLFNVKGGPSLFDVGNQIQPVIQMSTPPLEERYLVGVESFAAASVQVAVAANLSACMIRNPISSNVIAVVEKISVSPGTSGGIFVGVAGSNPADLGSIIGNFTRADPRSRTAGSCITSMGAPAADPRTGFSGIGNYNVSSVSSSDFVLYSNEEIVLLPQIALRVVSTTVNVALTWTLYWRERPLESSELT